MYYLCALLVYIFRCCLSIVCVFRCCVLFVFVFQCSVLPLCIFRCFAYFLGVELFHDKRSNDPPFMNKLSFFTSHEHSDRRIQSTSHRKVKMFQWIIQVGFDSLSLDLQSKSMDWFLYGRKLRHKRAKVKIR